MKITMKPIGYIESPYKERGEAPRQGILSDATGVIHILAEYKEGVKDIKEGSYGLVLFYFHKSEGYQIKTISRKTGEYVGVFSTRSPERPNGIGVSIVKFISIKDGRLTFKGVDMLEGTPVLDIKPYDPTLSPQV